jgi:nucleoside-specific outer membrane channel protein Tsx
MLRFGPFILNTTESATPVLDIYRAQNVSFDSQDFETRSLVDWDPGYENDRGKLHSIRNHLKRYSAWHSWEPFQVLHNWSHTGPILVRSAITAGYTDICTIRNHLILLFE